MGVPCKLGAEGIEQVIEVELTDAEKAELGTSADAVRELVGSARLQRDRSRTSARGCAATQPGGRSLAVVAALPVLLVRLAGRASERAARVPGAARRRPRARLRPALHPRLRAARARRVRVRVGAHARPPHAIPTRSTGRSSTPIACSASAARRRARLQGWLFDGHLRWHDHALIFLHSLHFAVPLGAALRRLARVPAALRPGGRGAARDVVRRRARVPRLPRRPTLAGRARGAPARRRADPRARRGAGRARHAAAPVRRQPRRRGAVAARRVLAARRADRAPDLAAPDAARRRLRRGDAVLRSSTSASIT